MVNAIQLLAYIRHMNLYMPSNAEVFFDYILELADFDLIDKQPAYHAFYEAAYALDINNVIIEEEEDDRNLQKRQRASRNSGEQEEEKEEKREKIDAETFTERVGPIILTACLVFLLLLIVFVLFSLSCFDRKFMVKLNKLRYALFWNLSLRTFMEGYLPSVYELLNQVSAGVMWGAPFFQVMDTFQLISLALTIILPFFIYRYLRNRVDLFRTP